MKLFKKQKPSRRRPTGQPSRPVASYTDYYRSDAARPTMVSQDKDEKKNATQRRAAVVRAHARRLPTYFAIGVILLSLLYSSIISNSVIVMLPEGKGLHDHTYYEAIASSLLSDSIVNKTKFTFNTQKFKQDLKAAVPEIKDVNLSVPLAGKKPVVGVTLYEPLYEFTVSGTAYIVAENGVIIDKADAVDPIKRAALQKMQDDAPLTTGVGRSVLLSSDMAFLQIMFHELQIQNIKVELATLPLGAGELYVKPVGEQYVIKFAFTGDARQQVGAYVALIQSGSLKAKPAQYIDVRLGDRVFVK